MSECAATREHLLGGVRGTLSAEERARVDQHLASCSECTRIWERERALDQALDKRPEFALPESLRQKLAARIKPAQPRFRAARKLALLGPSVAAALLLMLVVRGWLSPNQDLVAEAVNDHLRVLYAERPIEIESGGIHQVKPWFSGRLDFAPVLNFPGDEDFPLQGGAIALFVDRKAATFIFKRRLHTISLFVFRNEGLTWPLRSDTDLGSLRATSSRSRGFNTLLWRDGDLGYALVSDVDPSALGTLAKKIAAH